MSFRTLAATILLVAAPAARAADAYAVKVADNTAPPAEVAEPIRKLLGQRRVQLLDAKGELLAELWVRKEVEAKASVTAAQVQNGLTYRDLPETTVVGAVRLARTFSDYRKQKVEPGVYTLRLAFQPMDGDHMGTAPYNEFCLLSPAAEDKTPATMVPKALHEMSAKATGAHPGVLLLFPGKGAGAEPKLVDKGMGQWVVLFELAVKAAGKAATLPVGLTLVGASSSA